MHGAKTVRASIAPRWRESTAMLVILGGLLSGCVASDAIVALPPPEGLPDLRQLENHLDYVDPDDGKQTYVPRRNEGGNR